MKKLFKINQHEYLKTDRQGNICLRTTDANKLNKNKFISTFQNKLYRFFKNLCTRSTLKVHLFFKASSCETNFVSGNKLFKNSLAKILLGKNQKNKLIFWYWYETLPCRNYEQKKADYFRNIQKEIELKQSKQNHTENKTHIQ